MSAQYPDDVLNDFGRLTLDGFAVIAQPDHKTIPMIILGFYDLSLKCAFYYTKYKKQPDNISEIDEQPILDIIEHFKDELRAIIQRVLDQAIIADNIAQKCDTYNTKVIARQKRENEMYAREQRIASLNASNAAGTVSELAAKYHVSKSEIRKMRAAGTLDAYIKEHN